MSYFVDQDEILFRKTLKFSFLFYLVIGVGVALVHLPIPKQADIRHLSKRVAKLILEAPQVSPPPKVIKPALAEVKPKALTKKIPPKALPKLAKRAKKIATKRSPKKELVKPKAAPKPSASQNREVARKSGLLASLIAEEHGVLGQVMEDAQLDEVLSSVNVISSPATKKNNPSRLRRAAQRPSQNVQLDSRISGLGSREEGVQLAEREIVTVTEISAEYGGADGKGHGLGRGIGLQLKGAGSGDTMIDYDAIARVVEKYKGGLVYLYNKALRKNPTLKGTVTVEFSIDGNGKVMDAQITSSTMESVDLEKMLARRIKRWIFPKLYQGIIVVSYPFVFFPV